MDDTLHSAMRKHGLDTLQSAFTKLEYWLQKWTSDKERKKKNLNNWKKRLSPVDGEKKNVGGESLGDESASPAEKRQRKSPSETLHPGGGGKNNLMSVETQEEGEISQQNNDPMEIEPTNQDGMMRSRKSPERSNDKNKRDMLGEESSPEEGEVKDTSKDSGLPVAMDTDQPIGASIGRITLSPEKNKADIIALDRTEVPKELLKSPPELGLLGKASGDTVKAPDDLQQQSQTGFVEMFTCDVCKKAFSTYAEADVHEKECMAKTQRDSNIDLASSATTTQALPSIGSTVTSTQVTEKLNKSDDTEMKDPKESHDKLLEKYKNKKKFHGVNVINNINKNNTVQAYRNPTDYHRMFSITRVVEGTPLTLVEAAYASDQAFVVGYYLHKARSNKSLELLFAYLTGMRESIPELAAFGARQVYSKQFHDFTGSFTTNPSLNFFDLESLNKAYKKEVKKRQLDITGDGISYERRKDIFVAIVDAIIKKWKWKTQEMRVAAIEEMRNLPALHDVSQQRQQQEVPRINPTEEELSDVIVI